MDVTLDHHGSLFLFRPETRAGGLWLEANVPDAQWFVGALMVERPYATLLAQRLLDAGLSVE